MKILGWRENCSSKFGMCPASMKSMVYHQSQRFHLPSALLLVCVSWKAHPAVKLPYSKQLSRRSHCSWMCWHAAVTASCASQCMCIICSGDEVYSQRVGLRIGRLKKRKVEILIKISAPILSADCSFGITKKDSSKICSAQKQSAAQCGVPILRKDLKKKWQVTCFPTFAWERQPSPYFAVFLSPAVVRVRAGVSCRSCPALHGSLWLKQSKGPTLSSPQQLPARLELTKYETSNVWN